MTTPEKTSPEQTEPLVTVSKISKQAAGRVLLDNVSFTIGPQQIITLIGPNGSGKTTLIHAIIGLTKLDSGMVTKAAGLRIGYMPQRLTIDDTLPITVLRFLQLAERERDRCYQALEQVGIRHLHASPVQRLSGGETQRMLLARAILRRPNLLLLDEPVQGVDVVGQESLYRLIAELRDTLNCAVFMVSHDLHLVMAASDEVICLNHHICCHGSPESVTSSSEYAALFGPRTALYSHDHDHKHGLNEAVLKKEEEEGDHA